MGKSGLSLQNEIKKTGKNTTFLINNIHFGESEALG